MEEGRKHIDDLFREELEGYQEVPREAVWTSLEQRLPKKGGNRRPFLWIFLMVALLSSLGYFALREFSENDSKIAANNKSNSENNAIISNKKEHQNEIENQELNNAFINTADENIPSETKENAENTLEETDDKNSDELSSVNKAGSKQNSKTSNTESSYRNTNGSNQDFLDGETTKNRDEEDIDNTTKKSDYRTSKNTTQISERKNTSSVANPLIIQSSNEKRKPKTNSETKNQEASTNPVKSNSNEKDIAKKESSISTNVKNTKATASNKDVEKKATTTAEQKEKQNTKGRVASNKKTITPEIDIKKNTSNKQKNKEQKNTPPVEEKKTVNEKNKTASSEPKTTKADPIDVTAERSKGIPIDVAAATSKATPIAVDPELDNKKSKIDVSYQDANGNPIDIGILRNPRWLDPEKRVPSTYDVEGKSDAPKDGVGGEGKGGTGEEGKEKKKKENGLKLDAGIKMGYERGFANVTTSNFTGNVFAQWNISKKVALTLQPGIRYTSINNVSVFRDQAFHDVKVAAIDSAHVYTSDTTGTKVQRNYIYSNTYDSINMSYALDPRTYLEVELPLLLQYKVADNFSVLGGFQLSFGKIVQVKSSNQNIFRFSRMDTLSYAAVDTFVGPSNPAPQDHFTYSTPSYNTFNNNAHKNPITNPARFGIMLGFSYEFRKRLLIDVMMRKNLSNLNFIPNEEVRKIYRQPYFRISVGYRLFGAK